jgi:DNA gyrase subunit A
LKKDAVARVVLNNLYKYTQLRENFSANMLALVDGVPRTLSLDGFISNWVEHQVNVIVRRTNFRLKKAEERAHILRGYLKALDALDKVIALIRKSATADDAKDGLIKLLKIDELQARAILNMQLRQLAALERQKIIDEAAALELEIKEYKSIIARGGYIKRTKSTNYRSQHRGGKGVKGASLRADDVVSHFFVTTTHHWLLFFTNKGRVYRTKAYEVQEAGRDAKGQHVANLLALQPDEQIASILDIKDYSKAPYLVLATKTGLVKKTALEAYDTPRSGGIIAIKLKGEDEVVSAMLVSESDDLLLVSRKGMSIRFSASEKSLRAMGRDTSGNIGMNFRKGDFLLSATVINDIDDCYVFIATEGGYAKRTAVDQYRPQNRGGLGIKVAKLEEKRGDLVGAIICSESDEVLVVLASGKVVRSAVSEVPAKGRDTMGVVFARFKDEDSVIGLAKNSERNLEGAAEENE